MSDIISILSVVEQSDPVLAEQLLPLVHDDQRPLAAGKMRQDAPNQADQLATFLPDDLKRVLLDQAGFPKNRAIRAMLALDDAWDRLAVDEEAAGRRMNPRFFAGCSMEPAGEPLERFCAATYRLWACSRVWMLCALQDADD